MPAIFFAMRPLETCWAVEYMVSQTQVNTFWKNAGCSVGAKNRVCGKALANFLFLNDWLTQSI